MQWDIDLPDLDLIKKLGLDENGETQKFFTSNLRRRSDKYVPKKQGVLSSSAYNKNDSTGIEYVGPQARYLWYGKLMVDPVTFKGAFTDGKGRFWSRPGAAKILDPKGRNLKFDTTSNALATSKWVDRCWNAEKEDILKEIGEFINGKYY